MNEKMQSKILLVVITVTVLVTSSVPQTSEAQRLEVNERENDTACLSQLEWCKEYYQKEESDQPLYPYALQSSGEKNAPTQGLITSPPEYGLMKGVLFCYGQGGQDWFVRDMVVALTADDEYDDIAYVIVPNEQRYTAAINAFTTHGANMSKVEVIMAPSNVCWMRDFGPHFIWQNNCLGIVDSNYGTPDENFFPTLLGEDYFNIPTFQIGLTYPGGDFQAGPNRTGYCTSLINLFNPPDEGFNESFIADLFYTFQGIDTLHLFPHLPFCVDATGHLDMWMYIVTESSVIISEFQPGSNQNAINITNNVADYMENLGFTVYRTPSWNAEHPPTIDWSHFTYANALRVNNRIFIPKYGGAFPEYQDEDAQALAAYQAAVGPDVEIVQIACTNIIHWGGAMHCITMQVPRYTRPEPSVYVLSPAGGELFINGTTQTITWAATDTDNAEIPQIDLYYSTDNGISYEYIDSATNTGAYDWLVPNVVTDQAKIKIVAIASDTDQAEAESTEVFEITYAHQTTYDFSTGAGIDKNGYGYQTSNWSEIEQTRLPVTISIDTLAPDAYTRLACSDATGEDNDENRYRAPSPQLYNRSTHIYDFTIKEYPTDIHDIELLWEGYSAFCSQTELYLWDYVKEQWCNGLGGYGQNQYIDNWAGTRDGYLTAHIRSNVSRYISSTGHMTLLLYTEKPTGTYDHPQYHDYLKITVTSLHYSDLNKYPWYETQTDTGAATMKMMLDYLMWNQTAIPEGPPDLYDEQLLYTTYSGGDTINATELATGVNTEIDDQGHGWIYGYWLTPQGRDDEFTALLDICTWIDYPVDYYNDHRLVPVPKPGHTNHAPVAIPLYGTYTHWVSIRGIHTDQNTWPPSECENVTIYGFWLSDPLPEGIGSRTYVTADTLLSDYYFPLNQPGDRYHTQYVTVLDPPHLETIEEPRALAQHVRFAPPTKAFDEKQSHMLPHLQGNNQRNPFLEPLLIKAAYTQAYSILKYSDVAETFSHSHMDHTPDYTSNNCIVTFTNADILFKVTVNVHNGSLKQIQINNNPTLTSPIVS
jgi:agmatine/peptidylarginine deiminase